MKKIFLILAGILFLTSVAFNVKLLTSDKGMAETETLSEIQNKSESDVVYIQNLEDKIIEYENRISDLENENEESDQNDKVVANKLECLELVKNTPDSGNAQYIGIDIVGYYNNALERYNEVKGGKYQRENDPEDNKAELEAVTAWYNEAEPLYEEYSRKCRY